MPNARQEVVRALLKVDSSGGYSNIVLGQQLNTGALEPKERALAGALFYGVLERRITLDYILSAHCSLPLQKLNPEVLEILRVGVYQILYLDSVPDSAAVNESVKLARMFRKTSASGLINAVLRSFLRAGKKYKLPGDEISALSVAYSASEELCRMLVDRFGAAQSAEILGSSFGAPPVYARVNPIKTDAQTLCERFLSAGIEAKSDEQVVNCLKLGATGDVVKLPGFTEGFFHIQDKSSQLCCLALDPKPGDRIADVCAAPGGKSFTLAELTGNRCELSAFDLYPHRVKLIEEGAQRLGLSCVKAAANDASVFSLGLGRFDRILCDAPCSGFGILRRKPEIKYKTMDEIAGLPEIQYKILEISANYLERGGTLLYSTCTLNRAENEDIVERFLSEHPDFSIKPLPETLRFLKSSEEDSMLTLLPSMLDSDGFFFCTLTRNDR